MSTSSATSTRDNAGPVQSVPQNNDTSALWGDRPSTTIGALILKSLARARAAIIHESPPVYSRGAWAIISDIPYPPPPPYAGSSRHPPTYAEALEIGVVASPLRAEQRMLCGCRPNAPLPVSTACSVQLSDMVAEQASNNEVSTSNRDYRMTLLEIVPGDDDDDNSSELLPSYADIGDVAPTSLVVRRWRLGQAAFEKPPLHPRGFTSYQALPV